MIGKFESISGSKKRERSRYAALPFAEKLKLLEKLRDREAAIIVGRVNSPDGGLPALVRFLRGRRVTHGATPPDAGT